MLSLVQAFSAQVASNSDAPALEDYTTLDCEYRNPLTYGELDQLSDEVATALQDEGVQQHDHVPVITTGCFGAIVAMLATLKMRACYVPMDADSWDRNRITDTIDRVHAKVVISTKAEYHCEASQRQYRTVLLGEDGVMRKSTARMNYAVSKDYLAKGVLDDPAYVVFTSGTSGKPKGVVISQRSISAYVREGGNLPFNLNATLGSRTLSVASIAFDTCTGIIFSALSNGGTLVLASPTSFATAAKTCNILPLTPSILSVLDPNDGYEKVDELFLGGESPSPALVKTWWSPRRKIFNVYGPSEATCSTIMAELQPDNPVTMGWPISYGKIILVDSKGELSDEGEMLIGGQGLALRYHDDQILTEEAFVWLHGERFYRTRDYARRTSFGYAFLGRKDSMVKNRGFLVNLEGDVEPALLSHSEATAAAAQMCDGRLIGFVTPAVTAMGLREALLRNCSSFIVPDVIHGLDEFPKTGNGKADKRALLDIHKASEQSELVELNGNVDEISAVTHTVSHVLRLPLDAILPTSSFRAMGGHSLAAVKAVSALRKLGFTTSVSQIFTQDTMGNIAKALHKHVHPPPSSTPSDIDLDGKDRINGDVTSPYPATETQVRMIRATIDYPQLYRLQVGMTFDHDGHSDFEHMLRSAFDTLVERHEILRTSFDLNFEGGVQVVNPKAASAWAQQSVSSEEAWNNKIRDINTVQATQYNTFNEQNLTDLSNLQVITLPGNRTRVIWSLHHSLIDGWSANILLGELCELLGRRELPKTTPFGVVARLARDQLFTESLEEVRRYWKQQIGHLHSIPQLRLPATQNSTSQEQLERSKRFPIKLSDVDMTAQRYKVTSAAVVFGAWALLLSSYCDSEEVIIGAVFSGRTVPLSGIESMVGPLLSTLPLLVRLKQAMVVSQFLDAIFTSLHELLDRQWSPASAIHSATGAGVIELFQTILSIQFDFPSDLSSERNAISPYNVSFEETTEMPLTLLLDAKDGNLHARALFQTSKFEASTIERMLDHFSNLLRALIFATPKDAIGEVASKMMGSSEQLEQCLACLDHIGDVYTGPETLSEAFSEAVQSCHDRVALESSNSCTTRQMTYKQLDDATNKIAEELQKLTAIGPGKVVCIVADGSIEWTIAIVSIIKTGAAFCPIDEHLPVERQNHMVSFCSAPLVLVSTVAKKREFANGNSTLCLDIESLLRGDSIPTREPLVNESRTDDIAVVIFTSGSTGVPKAVQLQHKGILSLLQHSPARLHTEPGQRNAQALALGFDCCVNEVFSTLCYGGTLVLKDPADPWAHLASVDAMMATPSLLASFEPSEYKNLKIITLAGEAIPSTLVQRWAPGRILQNGYAPAECTLICTAHRLTVNSPISIGKPVPRTNFYILDKWMQIVPIGVVGEIYISGIQVTPGYLNNPEETNLRFLSDPFRKQWRMYKTGDLGRWLQSCDIEYIGRGDSQVKVRGFRIDLGGIEATIARLSDGVRNVAVIVVGATLSAFVTPETVNTAVLLQRLRKTLPEYSVPHSINAIHALPSSGNGKVDRKALSTLIPALNGHIVLPTTETEKTVAKVWADLLETKESIGINHGFFEIGGHSLLQIRVAQRLSTLWKTRIPLRIIIKHQILEHLSQALDQFLESHAPNHQTSRFILAEPGVPSGVYLASYLEQELFTTFQQAANSPAFNMATTVLLYGKLNLDILKSAFCEVVDQHKVLRSNYHVEDTLLTRSLVDPITITEDNISKKNVESFLQSKIGVPFQLGKESLVRMHVAQANLKTTGVAFVMCHLVGDAQSLSTFTEEVSAKYNLLFNKRKQEHISSTLSYLDWANWAKSISSDKKDIKFWQNYLKNPSGNITTTPLKPMTFQGVCRSWTLSSTVHRRLVILSKEYSITMHHLVLGAVFLSLQSIKRADDIVLSAPFSNRNELDTETVIGLFLDRMFIRLTWDLDNLSESPESALKEFLLMTRERSQQAMLHMIPSVTIRETLGLAPETMNQFSSVMVTYHTKMETSGRVFRFSDARAEMIHLRPGGAKFPLMFEFSESAGCDDLLVEMEYDMGIFSEQEIERLQDALVSVLEGFARGDPLVVILEKAFADRGRDNSHEVTS